MSMFADEKREAAELPSEHKAKELLQCRLRLAEELVDVRYDSVRATAAKLLGERPPDAEGIERLRRVTRELESARESLIDATCQWHYFVYRGNAHN